MRLDQARAARDPARRTLAISAAGALLGLILGGYALFTAGGTATDRLPPEDVALVNRRPILQSDFVTQTQIETGGPFRDATPAERRRVLDEMIDEELLVQRGLDVDLAASDPDVRSAMVAGVNLQVDAEVLASQPDPAALHAYYAAHAQRYTIDGAMDLRDLTGPGGHAAAQALADAIRGGRPVEAAAAVSGFADSGLIGRGDNYDFGVKAKLGDALFRAAAGLSDGQVAGPIAAQGMDHVLVMIRRKPITQLSYEAARDTVWQDMQRDARTRVERANLDFLHQRADIRIAPGLAP